MRMPPQQGLMKRLVKRARFLLTGRKRKHLSQGSRGQLEVLPADATEVTCSAGAGTQGGRQRLASHNDA